jgi:hypothetical protein
MMSLESIKQISRESGKKAAQRGLFPYVPIHEDEIRTYPPFPFPNLGSHRPKGWKLVDELFVDSSGWGAGDEPALSVRQLVAKLLELQASDKTYGYGIIETGQFQLYLGVFERRKHGSLGDAVYGRNGQGAQK